MERYVAGTDYRVLVVDGRVAAAAQLRPAAVTGDGVHDIQALVAITNADPRRGAGHARPLTRIALDSDALAHLAAQGLHPGSVPGPGTVVTLRRNANLSTGGTSTDVTDLIHPEVSAMCCRAAAAAGLDVCGVDVRLPDIAAPVGHPAGRHRRRHRGERLPRAADASRPERRPAQGRGGGDHRPALPARCPGQDPGGRRDRDQREDHDGPHDRAHSGHAGLHVGLATTDGVCSGGQLVHRADASGPRSAGDGPRRPGGGGGGAGDRPGRHHPPRPGLRQGERGGRHQHHRRPSRGRRRRGPRRPHRCEGAGGRGDQPGRHARAERRRRPDRRPRLRRGRARSASRSSATSAWTGATRSSWPTA